MMREATGSRARSFCRLCQAFCGTVVTVEDGIVTRINGDRDDPLSHGYICPKGSHATELLNSPARLRAPLRATASGFEVGASAALIAEAGGDLGRIIDRHGGGAVAFYVGTQALFNAASPHTAISLAIALGTPRLFWTMTIDQSAKWIAEGRLGGWLGGIQDFDQSDTWLLFGSNPLVSMVTAGGASQFAFVDPIRRLKAARARGMKLIVVDPRETETARMADLHLRPLPGFDADIAAALLREILLNAWHDAAFCAAHVDGLDRLIAEVEPFGIEVVAARSGVPAADLRRAARWFARDAATGMAGSGTGPNMARFSNLAEHLIQSLNVVCGRFPRAGERLANNGVLNPGPPPVAQSTGPARTWEEGAKSVRYGLGTVRGQMMTATLADDILWEGEDRIRALICIGGNPMLAWPDQAKTRAALKALELLIVVDPLLTPTAALADCVFAPRLMYERADHNGTLERMMPRGFVHVTPAVVPDPPGSNLVDDWEVLAGLGAACGRPLTVGGTAIADPGSTTTEAVLQLLSQAPLDDAFRQPGAQASDASAVIGAADANPPRFALLADDVRDEVAALRAMRATAVDPSVDLRLTVRRHRETMNSVGTSFENTRRRRLVNPAYIHSDDLARLDLRDGDAVAIRSAAGVVSAQLEADPSVRCGTIAVGHCWSGDADSDRDTTNRLIDAETDLEGINRMPAMTGMPVRVTRRDRTAVA